MNKGTRILKGTAAFAMALIPLPLLLLAEISGFSELSFLRIAVYYIIGAAVALGGYFAAKLLKTVNFKSRRVFGTVRILIYLCGIIPLAASFVVQLALGIGGIYGLLVGLSMVFAYFLGYRLYRNGFSEILTVPWFVICLLLSILVRWLYGEEMPTGLEYGCEIITWNAVVFTALAALLTGQSSLLTQAERRKETSSVIPTNLRRYSARLVGVIAGALMLLFLLKDFIIEGVNILLRFIWTIFDRLLFSAKDEPVQLSNEQDKIVKPDYLMENNELMQTVLTIFSVICVVTLLIVFRKKIWAGIKAIVRALDRLITHKKPETEGIYREYTDFTEIADPEQANRRRSEKAAMRRAVKDFVREKEPAEKLKKGYRAYMYRIRFGDEGLKISDTTDDHEIKAFSLSVQEENRDIETLKTAYEQLKYGADADNKIIGEGIAAAERLSEGFMKLQR